MACRRLLGTMALARMRPSMPYGLHVPTGSNMTRSAAATRKQGENLWMGTRGAYSYGEMIGQLVDERRYFRPGRFPAVSTDRRLVPRRPLYPDHLADLAAGRLRHRVQPRQ